MSLLRISPRDQLLQTSKTGHETPRDTFKGCDHSGTTRQPTRSLREASLVTRSKTRPCAYFPLTLDFLHRATPHSTTTTNASPEVRKVLRGDTPASARRAQQQASIYSPPAQRSSPFFSSRDFVSTLSSPYSWLQTSQPLEQQTN